MNKTLLYIHGFASSYNSWKAKLTEEYFSKKSYEVLHPTIPVEPKKAIDFLKQLYEKYSFDLVIGSSLGGFYALILNSFYKNLTLVINPSVRPSETLKDYVGLIKRHYSDDFFEWKQEFVDQLKELEDRLKDVQQQKVYFFIAKDDEILDPNLAEKLFPKAKFFYFEEAKHSFTIYSDVLPMIEKILQNQI